MQSEEMPKFVELLMALSLSYGQSLNEFALERYWQTLERFEFDDVKKALYACTTQNPDKGHFMPQATEVLRYLEGGTEVQALKAWTHVLKVIRHVGSYDSLVFDDPILHQVIDDLGGWIALCETTLDELKFKAHTFQKLYAAYVLHPPEEYPRKLSGRLALQNSLQGYKEPQPVLIGDKKKAHQVYQSGTDVHALIHREVVLLEDDSPSAQAPSLQKPSVAPEKKS